MILILLILSLAGLMQAARSFTTGTAMDSVGTAQAFGYLLLTGFFAGLLFKRIRLPKLTGYLATGIIVGPPVLGLVSQPSLDTLKLVSGVATALIALTAGTELQLRALKPLLRSILWITLVAVCGTTVLLSITVFLARPLLPFLAPLPFLQAAAVSLLLGVVISAQSPAVVVALRTEMNAEGPLTSTVLGVVVIADLVVIVMFAIASTLTKAAFGTGAGVITTLRVLAWELLGSMTAGVLIGLMLWFYLKKVRASSGLFILLTCCVIAEVGRRLDFDPLLLALAAGTFIRNVTSVGDKLHDAIESSALPIYVVFFAVAGATIHLKELPLIIAPALLFIVVRAAGFLWGAQLGARIAQAPEVVRRYAGFGLLPQAGLALALALLFSRTFPELGSAASALLLGIVALNEILAPAIYRFALVRSGEAGQGRHASSAGDH